MSMGDPDPQDGCGHGQDQIGLTFNRLRAANVARCKAAFPMCATWTDADWMVALVGEVGELANLMKKIKRGDYDQARVAGLMEMQSELGKELADIQTYLDLLADHLGVDLGRTTIAKFNEVSVRRGSDVRL